MPRPPLDNPQESICVWVSAGVLNYRRPCHRDYECDGCDLFRALQGVGKPLPTPSAQADWMVSAYIVQLAEGCDLHLDRPYTSGHFWIKEEADDEVLLGFDCHTIRVLFPVDDFILPKPGVWLRRGETMGWIQRGHRAIPLRSPMSGEVLEVNSGMVSEVKEVGFPVSQQRWLIRLKPHEPLGDIPGLLQGESMLTWYQRKLGLVHDFLRAALEPDPDATPTLNDGGELNRDLEKVLGSEPFREMLDALFRDPS